jgi:hypothetical protein
MNRAVCYSSRKCKDTSFEVRGGMVGDRNGNCEERTSSGDVNTFSG